MLAVLPRGIKRWWHTGFWNRQDNLSISCFLYAISGVKPQVLFLISLFSTGVSSWHYQLSIAIIWKLWPEAVTVFSSTLATRVCWLTMINPMERANLNCYWQTKLHLSYFKVINDQLFKDVWDTDSITFLSKLRQYPSSHAHCLKLHYFCLLHKIHK